jgi:hypothetical protein
VREIKKSVVRVQNFQTVSGKTNGGFLLPVLGDTMSL